MADLVTRALEIVLVQAQDAVATLVPIGTAVAGGLVALSILMLGAAIAGGQGALVAPIVRLCAAAAGTLWGIASWPTIVGDTFHASETILRMLTGGTGIVGLYTLGGDVAARVLAEGSAVSLWSPSSWAQAVVAGAGAFLVLLGMAATGILVLLAEIELLVGAALAPLLLPGLAFGLTTQLGWGAVYHLVRGALRVVATGTVAAVMARAVATVVAVRGTDEVLSFAEMGELVTLSVATAVVCFAARRIADGMVGSPGVLGLASAGRVGSFASAATGKVGGVVSAASAKGGRGAAAGAVLARSGGTGSAFPTSSSAAPAARSTSTL